MPMALKEWDVVCEALGSGRQAIVIRKGGIAEGKDGLKFEHEEFVLLPTFFHQQAERVIPEAHRAPLGDRDPMIDWACQSALDRLGFADPSELRAFWNLITPQEAKAWAQGALRRGEVAAIDIEGADGNHKRSLARPDVMQTAQDAPEPPPRRVRILSPFDPALRDRDRAEFLFGFRYRIEVFVPEAKRQYGYYVFPVLEGSRLIWPLGCQSLSRPIHPTPARLLARSGSHVNRRPFAAA
jgi:hypothetical protein